MELESFLKKIFKNCNNVYSYLVSICYKCTCNTEQIFQHKITNFMLKAIFMKLLTEDHSESNFSVTTGFLSFRDIYPLSKG